MSRQDEDYGDEDLAEYSNGPQVETTNDILMAVIGIAVAVYLGCVVYFYFNPREKEVVIERVNTTAEDPCQGRWAMSIEVLASQNYQIKVPSSPGIYCAKMIVK